KNANLLEKTKFEYDNRFSGIYGPVSTWKDFLYPGGLVLRNDNPNSLMYGILKSVLLPTGAKIEYEFGANKVKSFNAWRSVLHEDRYVDKNSAEYIQKMKDPCDFSDPEIQYLQYVGTIEFDTDNSWIYYLTNLQHSHDTRIYLRFDAVAYPWDTGFPDGDGGG